MNHSTLVWIHWSKSVRDARLAYAPGDIVSHRSQLGFAGGAKVIDITDNALAFRKLPPDSLIDEMLDGL